MKCPRCDERMYVKATIPVGDQRICRTYECKKCKFVDNSMECLGTEKKKEEVNYATR